MLLGLRLCDTREKVLDKVKATKNYRKNSVSYFYYIYNSTEKKGVREKKTLSFIISNKINLTYPQYTHQIFPHIKFKEIEAQNQGFPD
ncbi:hypothetical protein HQ584_12115 [Patescibacteria group bacterium]|nr:hypothetical protein [Patescibacteria group bacterium]